MPLGPFPGVPVLISIVYFQPEQMSLGQLTKWQLVTHYFEVANHCSIFWASSPPPPPPKKKSNVGIVDLLWMIQHQYCVRGGERKVDRKTKCWQKWSDQDCCYRNIDYTILGCLCLHVIPIHFRIKRLQVVYIHICTMFAEKFTEKKTGEW